MDPLPRPTPEEPLPRADVPEPGGTVPAGDAAPAGPLFAGEESGGRMIGPGGAVFPASPVPAPAPARATSRGLALAIGLAVGVGGGVLAFRDRGLPEDVEPGGSPSPARASAIAPRTGSPSLPAIPAAGPTAAPTAAPTPPPSVAPAPSGDGLVVVGPGAAETAAAASRAAGTAPGPRSRFVTGPDEDGRPGAALPAGARAVVALGEGTVMLMRARPAVADDAPDDAFTTPLAFVGDVTAGLPLAVPAPSRAAAVAALAAVLVGDGKAAKAALAGAPEAAGVRFLRAWAATLEGDAAGTHAALEGLGHDPDLGPAARFLTGFALLTSGSAKEALRDFEAALAERPAFWPARLMAGVADEALDLEDAADAAYAAVLAVAPDQPTARLRRAALLATPPAGRAPTPADRATAMRRLEALVAERPRFAAAWGALARLRARGETSEDVRGTATAFERVAALREKDPRAWSDLVAARAAWARAGGGGEAYAAAVDASARWTALASDDGLAWYDRGALLHQWALDFAAGPPGAESFFARLKEARVCYGKALAKGLPKPTAALVERNLGFLLEVCPLCAAEGEGQDLPATAADAFQAALRLDPAGVGALLGLAATRIAARDGAEGARLLGTLAASAEVDPREKEALLQAAAHVTPPSAPAAAGREALPDLCRTLIALGYRRVALTLLDGDTRDPTRLALRCRARAFLYDVGGLAADLALLTAADPAAAADLKAKDPVVGAALAR